MELLRTAGAIDVAADGTATVLLDIHPVRLAGRERVVFSDPDSSVVPAEHHREHVAGLGQASLSLARFVPPTPAARLLDLGCGCGAQSLAQLDYVGEVVATDVLDRALALTAATLAGAGADHSRVQVRQGSWFEPVAGERFDRIVANPPFVVGPPEVGHVYRDSGLGLDAASKLVVSRCPDYLLPGGRAYLLAAWVHRAGEPWQARVASWLPDTGVRAWVLERDAVDPATYIATWLADEDVDPRSREGRERTRRWLDYFDENEVEAIGFGYVALEAVPGISAEITAEELTQPFTDPLGPEVDEFFARQRWLAAKTPQEVLDSRFGVRDQLAFEEVSVPDTAAGVGVTCAVRRVTRTDGPRFSHEIDQDVATILAGLRPDGLTAAEVVELFAAARGFDAARLAGPVAAILTGLVRHGMVVPAELAQDTEAQ
ncbi:DUF7782 domain-containing protein [Corynebacterium atypicum]|uniref:DUF7782 domain-containing protein n=1 Tax=Corynebacterium atypicum TaxID=191610 RepID=UPI000AD05F50|nr:methyltransferase [Corynebacterium atypicum]